MDFLTFSLLGSFSLERSGVRMGCHGEVEWMWGPGSTEGGGWCPTTLSSPLLLALSVCFCPLYQCSRWWCMSSPVGLCPVPPSQLPLFILTIRDIFKWSLWYFSLPVLSTVPSVQYYQLHMLPNIYHVHLPHQFPYILLKKKIQRHRCPITPLGTEAQIPKKLWPHTEILKWPKRKEKQVFS